MKCVYILFIALSFLTAKGMAQGIAAPVTTFSYTSKTLPSEFTSKDKLTGKYTVYISVGTDPQSPPAMISIEPMSCDNAVDGCTDMDAESWVFGLKPSSKGIDLIPFNANAPMTNNQNRKVLPSLVRDDSGNLILILTSRSKTMQVKLKANQPGTVNPLLESLFQKSESRKRNAPSCGDII
jgi:hypothetical protein